MSMVAAVAGVKCSDSTFGFQLVLTTWHSGLSDFANHSLARLAKHGHGEEAP